MRLWVDRNYINDSLTSERVTLNYGNKYLREKVSDRLPNCDEKSHPNRERQSVSDTLLKTHSCVTERKVLRSCVEVTWPSFSWGFHNFPLAHCLLPAHLSLTSVSPGAEATPLDGMNTACSKSIVSQQRMRGRAARVRYFYLPHTCMSKGNAGCFKHVEVRVQNHKNLSKSKRSALRWGRWLLLQIIVKWRSATH